MMVMGNLANTLGKQGQLDKVAQMQKEVLEKARRILGEEVRNIQTQPRQFKTSCTCSKSQAS
jgi:hypothetical protein